MLVEFSVSNFKSFKDLQTLSLTAARIKSKYKEIDSTNVIEVSKSLKLLKSKALYGSNASGKSNIVKALSTMALIVRNSIKDEEVIQRLVKPFALSSETENAPTFFQIVFINDGVLYRYGFEVQENKILSEWLFGSPNKIEVPLFTREGLNVEVNERKFKEAKKFDTLAHDGNEIFRENSLFLSSVSAMGGVMAKSILSFFSRLNAINGLNDFRLSELMKTKISSPNSENEKAEILELIKAADLGIEDFGVTELKGDSVDEVTPEEVRSLFKQGAFKKPVSFFSKRSKYDEGQNRIGDVVGDFNDWESEGTKKFFFISPLLLRSLKEGRLLVIDEFDARLHPTLTKKIVSLFNSNVTNPNNAQLVFVTHDVNLLKANILRRDQICFVEKDSYGSTSFKDLVEFKGVRNDSSFDKDYIQGKYGAIPFLNKIDNSFQEDNSFMEHEYIKGNNNHIE